ncbi:GNAT family N-acetyltransferase [Pseudoblastomonas halimionae]|uniref:GNAT family N-acetyltransferase n=1 Tax=Alteriqipengyuania halimionae TaxID=1926630 RepID=A0A6I4TYW9_9SPHN|nr:GNAT family N-acetyltransferase [Alteriqipengyuania halimionae]MXP08726.1 GNAT family N-acetyltransferase [Alteriqipengyuania halimionae]
MFHRSERLLLRPPWPEDWQAIHSAVAEETVVRNLANAPWPYDEADARQYAAIPQDPRAPHFLLVLPTADGWELVGSAGMGRHEGEVEIGYWIARKFWGRGFATEAARAVIEIARLCGHRRLVAGHYVDNPASGRVLEKAGFVPTGRFAERHSKGRGGKARARLFALDLEADDPCMTAQAA